MKILYMTNETLHKKYGKKYDISNDIIVAISNDMTKSNNKNSNSALFNDVAPTNVSLAKYAEKEKVTKKFKKAYLTQLEDPVVKFQIGSVLTMAIKQDANLIFINSPREKEIGYHKLFIDKIKKEYGLPIKTFKEFKENSDDIGSKKIKEALKKLTKAIKELKDSGVAKNSSFSKDIMIIDMKNRLTNMEKKEIYDLAVSAGYDKEKISKMNKTELIKIIIEEKPSDKKKKDKKKKKNK